MAFFTAVEQDAGHVVVRKTLGALVGLDLHPLDLRVSARQFLPDFFEQSRLRNVVLVHVDEALAAFWD